MKKRVYFTEDKNKFDEQMAYLFAADRHDHLYNEVDGVSKLLDDGFHVISTRYYFSSLAYHCDDEKGFNFVRKLNEKFPDPDLVIYIDNPVEISLERIRPRSFADKYENAEKLNRVKDNYDRIFSTYSGLLLKVIGSEDIKAIHGKIISFIDRELL
jgi:dTMP kinase